MFTNHDQGSLLGNTNVNTRWAHQGVGLVAVLTIQRLVTTLSTMGITIGVTVMKFRVLTVTIHTMPILIPVITRKFLMPDIGRTIVLNIIETTRDSRTRGAIPVIVSPIAKDLVKTITLITKFPPRMTVNRHSMAITVIQHPDP